MQTILIITANDPNDRLNMLAREGKDIQLVLNSAVRKNYEVVLVPETTTADIIKELNVPNRAVEVLHYAGHANSEILRLTDMDADAQALADKLRSVGTLKLVFINGCASRGQVQFFHQVGIPFVIATVRPIDDTKAVWVANQFYQYLSLGRPLREAFDEVVKDAILQQKNIPFAHERGIMRMPDLKNDRFDWDLYIREGDENSNYTLPFSAKLVANTEGVNHTTFLEDLVYALAPIKSPHFSGIRHLAEDMERGAVKERKKLSELLKVLPYTLGIRVRHITANPDDKDSNYFRELLYDYVFLYETLLHHAASVLMAQLWKYKDAALKHKPEAFADIAAFWLKDRLAASPFEYKALIIHLLNWLKKADIVCPFSTSDTEGVLAYLHSQDFEHATAYFFLQKRLHIQRFLKDDELLANCSEAQQHLVKAFEMLKHLTAYFMVSVSGISIKNLRYVPAEYGNQVSKLVDIEEERSQTYVFSDKMLENKSVLYYQPTHTEITAIVDTENTTNLFPFVFDRNVFAENSDGKMGLYLFTGYFNDANGKKRYHFASIQDPQKIWQFDEQDRRVHLWHMDETVAETHQANHLMANAGEFRSYLTEFKNLFLTP